MPVGLSAHREGLTQLDPVSGALAHAVIDQVAGQSDQPQLLGGGGHALDPGVHLRGRGIDRFHPLGLFAGGLGDLGHQPGHPLGLDVQIRLHRIETAC